MFFCLTGISHFQFFGCHLGSQPGSLLQKCDPGRCDQNPHKIIYAIFTQQTFSIFISLAATWGPNFCPCGKSVILTGAIKIHIKSFIFFTQQTLSIFVPLAVTWCPNWDPCGKSVILAGAPKIT